MSQKKNTRHAHRQVNQRIKALHECMKGRAKNNLPALSDNEVNVFVTGFNMGWAKRVIPPKTEVGKNCAITEVIRHIYPERTEYREKRKLCIFCGNKEVY